MSTLQQVFESGTKAVTLEISPPKGTDMTVCLRHIKAVADSNKVHAINIPDSQRALLKMSSMACSKIVQDELGIETVWQITTRDRNVLALQADLMGAWAMGIKNVLALTGDPVKIGDQADVAKQVSHIDSLRLLEIIKGLNEDIDANGEILKKAGSRFFTGAALNPHRMSRLAQLHRLEYKIRSGVQFFQTQPVYDLKVILESRESIRTICEKYNLPEPKYMVGIIPPKNAEFARFLNAKIPGVEIPESFISLLEKSTEPRIESIQFCADLVKQFAPHVDGFHFMPVAFEKFAPDLLDACFG